MKNYDSGNAFTFNKKLNDGVRELITGLDGDYFVTAVFNRQVGMAGAEASLQHWYNCMNRKLYGKKKWFNLAAEDRLQYVAVAENVSSNLHWHMVVKAGGKVPGWKFKMAATHYWEKYNKSGSMDVQKMMTAQDKEKVAYYVTKDTWQAVNYDNIRTSA